MQILPQRFFKNLVLHGSINDPDRSTSLGQKFVSALATGAHINGNIPGSAPQDTVYWLGGVLVMLTAQLFRPNAVHDGISLISDYYQENHHRDCIDAVLMTIEDVVLVMYPLKVSNTVLSCHSSPYQIILAWTSEIGMRAGI